MRPILCLKSLLVFALLLPISAFGQEDFRRMPPKADEVFQFSVHREDGGRLQLHWTIDTGNYLYRDSIEAELENTKLLVPMPAGDRKDDPNFGEVAVFHKTLDLSVQSPATGELRVTYRGCAEAGICYPPISKTIDLATLQILPYQPLQAPPVTAAAGTSENPRSNDAAAMALDGNILVMMGAFLGFGLLLAFTPCVFPMVPILSAMLAGAGSHLTIMRSFALSMAYVASMATAYGLVGLVAGYSGANLQVALQTPWALALSAAVFVGLALSMFGTITLPLPAGLTSRFARQRSGGSIAGAAALGFGSALIVSPCVTPPLAAAILYTVQDGHAWRGAAALSFLGFGMGMPLVVFGTLGPRFLPKSGVWLEKVSNLFGFVLLGVALMLLTRLLSASASMAAWGAFAVCLGVSAGAFDRIKRPNSWTGRLSQSAGLIAILYGTVLIIGFAGGGTDPMRPLAFLAPSGRAGPADPTVENQVTSSTAFDSAVGRLGQSGKPILVSFTADWCTACKSNEAVLAQPSVHRLLTDIPVIVADVTAQSADQRALMKRFAIVGPPTMFVLNGQGREQSGSRLVGPVSAEEIIRRLRDAAAYAIE